MQPDLNDLNSIIKILAAENAALSDKVENTLLFRLAAETIYKAEDSDSLIEQILERISILKNIPFCSCYQQTSSGNKLEGFYASFGELQKSEIQISIPQLGKKLIAEEGSLVLDTNDFAAFGFSANILSHNFIASSALIIPCQSKSTATRYFVFLDDNKDEIRFYELAGLFLQIIKLAAERLENIYMFAELSRLNQELDQRVKERTNELTRINTSLNNEIQERKIIEKVLSENEQKLLSVYNAAIDVAFITIDLSKDFNIVSFSPGAELMFEYLAGEVIGKPLRIFRLPYKLKLLETFKSDFGKVDQGLRTEIVLRRKSGKYFSAILTFYPLYDEAAVLNGVLAVCVDISALKQTQQELIQEREKAEENEYKFRSLFEQASDGIFISDRSGNYIEVNENGCQMLGYSRDEILKLNVKDVILKEDLASAPVKLLAMVSGNNLLSERMLVRKDGRVIPVEISGKLISDDRVQGIVRDITDRKIFEGELIAAKEKAEESDRLKTAFLQNISHEIRTPLNAILGFADLLPEDSGDEEKLIKYVNIIKQKGNDLLEILGNILDISRIDSGQILLKPEEFKLNLLCDEIEEIFRKAKSRYNSSSLKFSIKADRNLKALSIIADREKLKQVLVNLIENAFKFTRSGKIEFGFSVYEQNVITFHVSDTGIGIPKEQYSEIFRRFSRGGHRSAQLYGGTGLGLSIVMGLVDLMGGKVWLDSELEKGSTFYFTMPFESEVVQPIVKHVEKVTEIPDYRQNAQILLVESDEFNAMYIKEILSETDYVLIHISNAEKAVGICSQNDIKLVLYDLSMPAAIDYQTIKLIRKNHPEIGIIGQTTYSNHVDEKKALEAGCNDYLSKPIKGDLLLMRISQFVNQGKKQINH